MEKNKQVCTRLGINHFKKPVSAKALPSSEISSTCKAAIDYKDSCEAAGRIKAENYIAGGFKKIYKMKK